MEMNQYRISMLARSKAGHDKNEVFVVTGEQQNRLLLSDGKGRTLEKPKEKNRAHVQLITHISEELAQQMAHIEDNADVRRILKQYGREKTETAQ